MVGLMQAIAEPISRFSEEKRAALADKVIGILLKSKKAKKVVDPASARLILESLSYERVHYPAELAALLKLAWLSDAEKVEKAIASVLGEEGKLLTQELKEKFGGA